MTTNTRGTAVITGAAGGIGLATAKALQSAGYRVFGTSRKPVASPLPSLTMLVCDVTDDVSVARMVAEVTRQSGRIDVLVNNAGSALIGGAEESSIDQAKALFDTNVFGMIRVTNAVLPILRRQKTGRIVNISSVVGFIPSPFSTLYTATKHAVEGYSESLDHEVRGFGIRVLLVEPAFTSTGLDHNAPEPDRMMAIYDVARAAAIKLWNTAIQTGDSPDVVGAAVVTAATAKAPRLRYPASKTARRLRVTRRFVPAAAFDRRLRKQMGLPV